MARRAKKTAAAPSAAPVLGTLGEPLAGPGRPLRVTARLAGGIALPWGPLALDGLLAWAVCAREGMLAPVDGIRPVAIPVELEPAGRFHLASFSVGEAEEHEHRWVNRRFPVPEAQGLAEVGFSRINISAGAQKTYRLPLETVHLRDDRLAWYLLGDRDRVLELLDLVRHLGKRRAVGYGQVREWSVEECGPWAGFPVLDPAGQPLRPLPLDWPGLSPDASQAFRRLSFPYWLRSDEQLCAAPDGQEAA